MQARFVFEGAPFASAHASTIAATSEGLAAAWFGGPHEGHRDVGIWLAHATDECWSAPVEIARGADRWGRPQPCWNPVLFQPSRGPLLLFYRVGPSPRRWWSMSMTSTDGGRSWSPPRPLPRGMLGPIKNKPVELADRVLLCPSSTEQLGWRVHLERTPDLGQTWQKLTVPGSRFGAIQPCLLTHADRIRLLCRTRQRVIATAWSADAGDTWSPLQPTDLPNPDSGIDALTLHDGRAVLAYNPSSSARSPLALAISDDGERWRPSVVLEDRPGEYSYPAVIQARDDRIHVTYTWNRRRIRHVALRPDEL